MENEDGYCFQKLGMHEGKKGVCEQYGFQVSLSAIALDSMRDVIQMPLVRLQQCRWAYYYF